MTKYFFDTEFDEDGKTIELISIGIRCTDGREYYAVSRDFDPLHCNDWVKEHVLTQLPPAGDPFWRSRAQIRDEIREFVDAGPQLKPEFWAYYADYDWVVFCQLWGKMIDLPPGWPMYCRDLKQLADHYQIMTRDLPEQIAADQHHALLDARWNQEAYEFIERFYMRKPRPETNRERIVRETPQSTIDQCAKAVVEAKAKDT